MVLSYTSAGSRVRPATSLLFSLGCQLSPCCPFCCPIAGTPYVQAFGALLPPINDRPQFASTLTALQASLNDDSTTQAQLCPVLVRQCILVGSASRTKSCQPGMHPYAAKLGSVQRGARKSYFCKSISTNQMLQQNDVCLRAGRLLLERLCRSCSGSEWV